MTSFGKTIFLCLFLAAILDLVLRTGIPVILTGVLFLPVSFLASLSAGAQSFTIARLPFLFINGVVFFLLLAQGEISRALFLKIGFIAIAAVFLAVRHFSSLLKRLPNIQEGEYDEFMKKYRNSRDLVFSFLFLTAFVWYANAFVVYSVLGFPFFSALLLIFFITFSLTSFMLKIYSASSAENKTPAPLAIYSWTMGLAISQMAWIIGFWPFGYLTASLIITIIYYTASIILKEYLFGRLKPADTIRELFFAGIVIAIIFYFTKWFPL